MRSYPSPAISMPTLKKSRGVFLTVVIAFEVLTIILKVFSDLALFTNNASLEFSPSGSIPLDMTETAILAVGLVGVLRWKKWGFYLVLIRLGITILVQLFLYQSLGQQLIGGYNGTTNVVFDFVGVAFWIVAVSRKWSYFE